MNLKELYTEISNHLLNDEKPSDFINEISGNPLFLQAPFKMLNDLKKVEQSPIHHPEGNVWIHTMLVIDEAAKLKAKSKNAAVFMWAALLHDIGKASATKVKNGKITAYDHDKIGAKLAKEFLLNFVADDIFIEEVIQLVRYHMQLLFVVNNSPYSDILGMKRNTDINEVALLGLADRLGRTNCDKTKEEINIELFMKKCN